MNDPCDNCNKPCCYGCIYADCEPAEEQVINNQRKEYLVNQIHQAFQLVWWLSYQAEMSDSECQQLKRMSNFLEDLRERIKGE